MATARAAFGAQDIKPMIGSNVSVDRDALLCGTHASELMDLLDRRGVLVFRGADLDDVEQLAFARSLGKVSEAHGGGQIDIGLDKKRQIAAETVRGTFHWHMDGAVDAMPPRATILSPRRFSNEGGQTEYCNLYAAYEALADEDKHALAGLRVLHDREHHHRLSHPDPDANQLKRWRALPPREHPLVWTHASGRKSLTLGATAAGICGMTEAEARALIDRLMAWVSQPEFVYRHDWQAGDLVMWDNCGTLHRVVPYPLDSDRLMHRITLQGVEAPA